MQTPDPRIVGCGFACRSESRGLTTQSPVWMPVRGHGRNFKELGHPSDGAGSIYGRHRIAVIDFNFVWTHLLHSGAYVVLGKSGGGGKRRSVIAAGRARA